jgi:uncharacterized delta-60 repeat protein
MKQLLRLFLLLCALGNVAIAQTFVLDSTFSGDGLVTTDHLNHEELARTIAIQADGKIIVAGKSNFDFILIRYSTTGVLDSTFDVDGIVNTDISNSSDEGKSLVLQPDGKILLAGITTKNGNANFSLARYHPNGTLDSTFSGDGKLFTPVGNSNDEGKALALQADGKMIVVGQSINGLDNDFAMVRYDSFGELDSSFGGDGIVISDLGGPNDEGNCIRLQPDGKIVVAGYSGDSVDQDFAVARYHTDGSLDSTFGLSGRRIVSLDSGKDIAFTMAIQADAKILAAGITDNGTNKDFAVIRLDSTGALDGSFDTDGIQTAAFGAFDDLCQTMALQADGKIILGGTSFNGNNKDFAFLRIDQFGKVDSTMDGDGRLTTDFATTTEDGFSMLIQPLDGKILMCGEIQKATLDFAVARYTSPLMTNNGQSSPTEAFQVMVFPNPFTADVTLRIAPGLRGTAMLHIVNALGQEVYSQKLTTSECTFKPHLPRGMYFFTVRDGQDQVLGSGRLVAQ